MSGRETHFRGHCDGCDRAVRTHIRMAWNDNSPGRRFARCRECGAVVGVDHTTEAMTESTP